MQTHAVNKVAEKSFVMQEIRFEEYLSCSVRENQKLLTIFYLPV